MAMKAGDKPRAKARTARAGKARGKLADLPDLMPHTLVADKLGVTTVILRTWVDKGIFPVPHSELQQTWLYRVDVIRTFLETGQWPDGVKFGRSRVAAQGLDDPA